jgi:putative alpha-1,2-mannosidase
VCVTFKGDGYELGNPTEYGVYSNNYPVRGARSGEQVYLSAFGFLGHRFEVLTLLVFPGSGSEHGALLEFTPSPSSAVTSILARVGVSFISTDQACSTAEEEIPDYDFEKVKSDARAQWNDVLGRVKVRFGDAGERTTEKQKELVEHFYSSVSLSVYLKRVRDE